MQSIESAAGWTMPFHDGEEVSNVRERRADGLTIFIPAVLSSRLGRSGPYMLARWSVRGLSVHGRPGPI
jgi:hypothetical protein